MKKSSGLSIALKAVLFTAFMLMAASTVLGEGSATNWQVMETKYPTDDVIVAGCTVQDFGAAGDGVTDDTKAFQDALTAMGKGRGGTVFVPAGKYVIQGALTVPRGVVLRGDLKAPAKGQTVEGTVLMAYGSRGNADGKPLITLTQNAGVKGVAIWYPEQTPDDITFYPPSILMGGQDYCSVENVIFVNSYVGFEKNRDMTGCPVIRKVYGTPLKTGVIIDSLADVGRLENADFSPEYWEGSGLPGAPSVNGPHREWLYKHGIGVRMHRNDWSYGRFISIDGYNTGFYCLNSNCSEATSKDGVRLKDQFPNGENYGLTIKNCNTAIQIENTSNSGVQFTKVDISECINGLVLPKSFNSKTELQGWTINVSDYAVLSEGSGRLMMQGCTINNGKFQMTSGHLTIGDSDLNNAAPQIVLEKESTAVITGNRYKNTESIQNNSAKKVIIDNTPMDTAKLPDFPSIEVGPRKPAKAVLYNVMLPPYNAKGDNSTDDTAAIQGALDQAQKDGGGIVFLPPANYVVKGNLEVAAGVELRGALDTPQMPKNVGSTIEVYADRGNENGTPFLKLAPTSILRGMSFDYPEQIYNDVKPYPYLIQGLGKDVSVINVAMRSAYNGMDFYTNKCDNHYIEYFCGMVWNIGIKVGGGSENGRIYNTQVNLGTMVYGQQDAWGAWPNSPDRGKDKTADETINKYLKTNFKGFILGDSKNNIFYNNFIIPAGVGLSLIKENGRGPSGISLGYASDDSRIAFEVQDVGEGGFDFINSQLVGIHRFDLNTVGIQTTPEFDKKINFFGLAVWGSIDSFATLDGPGSVEVHCANFASMINRPFLVNKGNLKVVNSKINKYKQTLFDAQTGAAFTLQACNYEHENNSVPVNEADTVNKLINNVDLSTTSYVSPGTSAVKSVEVYEWKRIKVLVDGMDLKFADQVPIYTNDRVLVPMRAIFESLGANIEWQDATETVTAKRGDTTISLKIGSTNVTKNGETIALDVPAKMMNGRTMVPVRFIGESFGAKVGWDEVKNIVTIDEPINTQVTSGDANEPIGKLTYRKAVASDQQLENPVENSFDGDMNTRWAAEGEQWAAYDLGTVKTVSYVNIAFYNGETRVNTFTIDVSLDGKSWTTVLSASASGKTRDFEKFAFPQETNTKYVRYSGKGSNISKWNSLLEFDVYGYNSVRPGAVMPEIKEVEVEEVLPVASSTASGGQAENPVQNSHDGQKGTRWSAEGNHSATYDLGAEKTVTGVSIAFFNGVGRNYVFTIETSVDGKTWAPALSAQSAGKSEDFEKFAFTKPATARYVRFNGTGSQVNKWNGISEFQVMGR